MLLVATVFLGLTFVRELKSNVTWTSVRKSVGHKLHFKVAAGVAAATLAFALASLLWAPEFERGLRAGAQVATAVLATAMCCLIITRNATIPAWVVWALPLSVALACIVIFIEYYFGLPIRSALGASPDAFRLNRAAVAVALVLPLLFLIQFDRKRLLVAVIVSFLVLVVVFSSDSESAKFAVVVITMAALSSVFCEPRRLTLAIGLAILVSHILAPVVVIALHATISPDLVASVASVFTPEIHHFVRLEIWNAFAHEIFNAPLHGHGLQASLWAGETYAGEDPAIRWSLGGFAHPHNASLQIWYELGLVGVLLTSTLMALVLRQVLQMPPHYMRITAVLIAGAWSVAYVSHGAWQGWWWALVGSMVILLLSVSRVQHS